MGQSRIPCSWAASTGSTAVLLTSRAASGLVQCIFEGYVVGTEELMIRAGWLLALHSLGPDGYRRARKGEMNEAPGHGL